MSRIKVRKLTVRKHNGDDAYSYAVFEKGKPTPIVTGCSRAEANSHKGEIERMFAERDAVKVTTLDKRKSCESSDESHTK